MKLAARWSQYGKDGNAKVSIITESTVEDGDEHLVAAENPIIKKLSLKISDTIETNQ